MIRNQAERILELLRQGKGLSEQEITNPSIELSKIVSMILSECKCSLIDTNGNYIRYGSSIDIDIVEKVIFNLLSEKNIIPKKIVSNVLFKEGIEGPNTDIVFNKKYNRTTNLPEIEIQSIMPSDFDDYIGKNNSDIQQKIIEKILNPYVKELVFSNNDLMKRSPIGAFISKSLFRKKSIQEIKEIYINILKKELKNPNEEQIKNFVDYIVENVLQNQLFKLQLINSSINSTELQVLGRVYTGFSGLVYNMATSTLSMIASHESPNIGLMQIQDIYYTMVAVLTALSFDLSKLDENQMEKAIKIVNGYFNVTANNLYLAESHYRTNNVEKDLYGTTLKFVEPNNIEQAMKELYKRLNLLITNREKVDAQEFIKEVMRINYRFIRIHPFKSANGRTSRALINMILQTKGMSAYFEKGIRQEYIKSVTEAHNILSKYEDKYIYELVNNPVECFKFEELFLQNKIPILIIKD